MRRQPGSAEPFGLVRIIGCRRRSGWAVMAGASLPLMHSTLPVGCDGSWSSVKVPLVTVARAPQRDTHKGQYVATSVEVDASAMASPLRALVPGRRVAVTPPANQRTRHADRALWQPSAGRLPATRAIASGSRAPKTPKRLQWRLLAGRPGTENVQIGHPVSRPQRVLPLVRCAELLATTLSVSGRGDGSAGGRIIHPPRRRPRRTPHACRSSGGGGHRPSSSGDQRAGRRSAPPTAGPRPRGRT